MQNDGPSGPSLFYPPTHLVKIPLYLANVWPGKVSIVVDTHERKLTMRHTKNILKTLLAATLLTLLMTLAGCDNRPYNMGCYPNGYYGCGDYGYRDYGGRYCDSGSYRGGRAEHGGNWGHGHEFAYHGGGGGHHR